MPYVEAERPDGQPRRGARLHGRRAGAARRQSDRTPGPFPPACSTPTQQRRPARRRRLSARQAGTILRGGYSITYNSGSYASIARQLVGQPPFAATETVVGRSTQPLRWLEDAARSPTSARRRTTAAWTGLRARHDPDVERDRQPGTSRQIWTSLAGYTGTKGTDLDLLSAPNRGPDGAARFRTSAVHLGIVGRPLDSERRQLPAARAGSRTASAAARPTRCASRWTTRRRSAPAAPWSRRTTGSRRRMGAVELRSAPAVLGQPVRRAAVRGRTGAGSRTAGFSAACSATGRRRCDFTAQSGTPFTARVCGAASDIAQGTNGRCAPTTRARRSS